MWWKPRGGRPRPHPVNDDAARFHLRVGRSLEGRCRDDLTTRDHRGTLKVDEFRMSGALIYGTSINHFRLVRGLCLGGRRRTLIA